VGKHEDGLGGGAGGEDRVGHHGKRGEHEVVLTNVERGRPARRARVRAMRAPMAVKKKEGQLAEADDRVSVVGMGET